jgi:hypothetical protein
VLHEANYGRIKYCHAFLLIIPQNESCFELSLVDFAEECRL